MFDTSYLSLDVSVDKMPNPGWEIKMHQDPDVEKLHSSAKKLHGMLEVAIKIGEKNLQLVFNLRRAINLALLKLRIGKVDEAKKILEQSREN